MACLTALASRFRGAFAIVGEIAGAVLTADLAGARGFFAIFGEIAGVSCMGLLSHWFPLSQLLGSIDPAEGERGARTPVGSKLM
jgi:predicted membrane protein